MRMSRRMAFNSQCGGKIKEPLYTGNYTITQIGEFIYMYLLTSGTLTIQSKGEYDLFCVGGGGKGGWSGDYEDYGCTAGGGGSGYTATMLNQELAVGESVSVRIGSGGTTYGSTGGTTSIGSFLSASGGKSKPISSKNSFSGAAGGSGGGGYGNNSEAYNATGKGGSNGSNGSIGGTSSSGGAGQGTTTRAFGESTGTLYAGGGGGGNFSKNGGAGGGGSGGNSKTAATAGTANTGGGGGGGCAPMGAYTTGANGGSGIAIIRWKAA